MSSNRSCICFRRFCTKVFSSLVVGSSGTSSNFFPWSLSVILNLNFIITIFRMEQSTTSITQQQQQQRLLYPPYQYFFHHSQLNQSKAKVLASLQQIGYEVEQFQDKPINDIMKVADQTLKKSYTVKLVAVKDGEIGVLSRRVEMKDRHKQNEPKQSLLSQNGQSYVINNYFYPKHLKALKKAIDPREEEQKQKLYRWQAEQYEKMKGRALDLLPDLDDDSVKPFEDPKIHSNKLVIAGLGALKKREKGFVLPNVKRLQMGQLRRDETDEQRAESQPLPGQESKKLSYSRLLADLTERDLPIPVQKLAIETVSQHPPQTTMIKPGGVILELDEENENSPDGAVALQMKLPSLSQSKKNYKLPKNDSDNLQKRIRKFQDKLIE